MADPYIINWSNNSLKAAISLPEKTLNPTSTSVVLTGRGIEDYGEIQQENFIRLLENFASAIEPPNPTIGQLWYQTQNATTTGTLRIRSRSNLWEDVFPLQPATASTRGTVKVGSTLTLAEDGTVNYNLPIASESVLGGVKVAENSTSYGLKITGGQSGGLLEYILPQASATILGGVKIAPSSNITITGGENGGFIDYNLPIAQIGDPANANSVRLGGVRIKQGGGLSLDANGFLSSAVESITPASPTNLGGVKVGEGLAVTVDGTLNLAVASSSVLGGVKIGNGLTITADGTMSVSSTGPTGPSGVTSVNVSGASTGLTFSGGPVTSSGTITLGGILGVSNGGTGLNAASLQDVGNAILPSQTGKAGSFLTTNGTNTQWTAPAGTIKAWVSFEAWLTPGTIIDSANVSSVTFVSTGVYTINLTTPLNNSTYAILGWARETDNVLSDITRYVSATLTGVKSTTQVEVVIAQTDNGDITSSPEVNVVLIG